MYKFNCPNTLQIHQGYQCDCKYLWRHRIIFTHVNTMSGCKRLYVLERNRLTNLCMGVGDWLLVTSWQANAHRQKWRAIFSTAAPLVTTSTLWDPRLQRWSAKWSGSPWGARDTQNRMKRYDQKMPNANRMPAVCITEGLRSNRGCLPHSAGESHPFQWSSHLHGGQPADPRILSGHDWFSTSPHEPEQINGNETIHKLS